MSVTDTNALAPRQLAPGVVARLVHGDALTLMRATIEAGATLPLHRHPHEQATTVLRGQLRLTIAGTEHLLGPGMTALIPGNVEHGARAVDECEVLDVFTPVREDYR
jgi:quercetin dioxygenase-like cupin family protein